jgi:hypothetical protein
MRFLRLRKRLETTAQEVALQHTRVRHPVEIARRRDLICALCAEKPRSVAELVEVTGMTTGAIHGHLEALRFGTERRLRICGYTLNASQKRVALFAPIDPNGTTADAPRPPPKKRASRRKRTEEEEASLRLATIPRQISPHPIMQAFFGLPPEMTLSRDPARCRLVANLCP